jgi:transcriptional regulator with XRE-family HTH domain
MNINSPLTKELKDKKYREGYVGAQVSLGLPNQIRALRAQRKWTQEDLAQLALMKQPRISEIETPGERKLNLDTLMRIAAAFDVGLEVAFVPFSELVQKSEGFDPDSFSVKSFSDELEGLQSQIQQHQGRLSNSYAALPGVRRRYFRSHGHASVTRKRIISRAVRRNSERPITQMPSVQQKLEGTALAVAPSSSYGLNQNVQASGRPLIANSSLSAAYAPPGATANNAMPIPGNIVRDDGSANRAQEHN